MQHSSFFGHRRLFYFWSNLFVLAALLVGYVLYAPIGGRNGGTLLGYAYGGFATLAIVWLAWFGIRKRSYYRASDTLRDWLAGHVWLGLILLVIVPLHSGFSFGLNVHTLAYVLMALVILTGLWGAVNYVVLAPQIPSHRGLGSLKAVLEQIDGLERDLNITFSAAPALRQKLLPLEFSWRAGIWRSFHSRLPKELDHLAAGKILSACSAEEREKAAQIFSLLGRKLTLCRQLEAEVRAKALLKFWLYVHLPCTCALLIALAAHIFSVFYYW